MRGIFSEDFFGRHRHEALLASVRGILSEEVFWRHGHETLLASVPRIRSHAHTQLNSRIVAVVPILLQRPPLAIWVWALLLHREATRGRKPTGPYTETSRRSSSRGSHQPVFRSTSIRSIRCIAWVMACTEGILPSLYGWPRIHGFGTLTGRPGWAYWRSCRHWMRGGSPLQACK